MSLPVKSLGYKDTKPSPSKLTTLNPNAAEFVPSSLRSANGNNINEVIRRKDNPGTSRKVVLDRSDSTNSNNSDDELHQYWRHKLPDDITPDFTTTEGNFSGPEHLSFEGLSIHDSNQALRFQTFDAQLAKGLSDRLGYSASSLSENHSSTFIDSGTDSWGNRFMNADQNLSNGFEGHHANGCSNAGLVNNLYGDLPIVEDSAINHVEFLALQFPGFSAESLADIYCANGGDLNLTIEILTQLELQVDGGFTQNQNSKAVEVPSLTTLDFPALPGAKAQNGYSKYSRDDMQQSQSLYRSSSSILQGVPDFASTVRKLASQGSGVWKYERNDPMDAVGCSNGSTQLLTSSWKGPGKFVSGAKFQGFGTTRSSPVWLETGEAVANMYSASRGEARDYARLRNACFQQARDAYMIGNKALAKELGDKGKLYNLQMKEAHAKAREAIYRQRNPLGSETSELPGQGQERMIDLHGLHVSEALHVLKHELSLLRSVARSGGYRLPVLICVGTGHHTKGARTPARLPIAVEQYLLEEGLHYTQPQPGLLRVVIH
ncbi:hypothetical protein HPP92_015984 [Vanilla planifolia]|uniref:Smr domain-containing protein n=1 Tax=Vanilla planifolia TaxID=51239 RepID=A0A835QMR7_VANPL|nr:hypothetical protein HPP92_016599 [Vanilla planifolia]KAG0471438.1 hypothetical protein HPP92_015984 [Vanilla planifolia]